MRPSRAVNRACRNRTAVNIKDRVAAGVGPGIGIVIQANSESIDVYRPGVTEVQQECRTGAALRLADTPTVDASHGERPSRHIIEPVVGARARGVRAHLQ